MKKTRTFLIISLLTLSMILSACGSRMSASSWPGISVNENEVYLAYNQHVYALDLNSVNQSQIQEKWRFPAEAQANVTFFTPPVLTEDGQLLVGGYDNVFYSLDPHSVDKETGV